MLGTPRSARSRAGPGRPDSLQLCELVLQVGAEYGVWSMVHGLDTSSERARVQLTTATAGGELVTPDQSTHSSRILATRSRWLSVGRVGTSFKEHLGVATALFNCGFVYHRLAVFPVAIRLQSIALGIREANPGATKTAMAQSANALATSYAAIGDTSRAIKHHGEALRIRRAQVSSHGGTHEMEAAASSMYRLAMVHLSVGRLDKAQALCKEALAMAEAAHPKDAHDCVAHALHSVAQAHHRAGRYGKACTEYQRAVAMFRAVHGQHTYHYDVAAAETHLGWLHVDMGTKEALTAAEGYFRKAVDAYRRLYGDMDHCDLAYALHGLARLNVVTGSFNSARRLRDEALAMYRNVFGHGYLGHPSVAKLLRLSV